MVGVLVLLASSVLMPIQLVPASDSIQCSGHVVAQSLGSDRSVRAPIATKGVAGLELTASERWRIFVDSETCWSARAEVDPSGAALTQLAVWPKSWIAGKLSTAVHASVPQKIDVEFRRSITSRGQAQLPLLGVESCAVENAKWRCPAPAATVDLRISAKGFAPAYLWGLQLERGEIRLPDVSLTAGASLAGWVEDGDGTPIPNAEVVLMPSSLGDFAARRSGVLAQMATVRSDARGFFQFTSLTAGDYRLEARNSRMSLTRPLEVAVRDGQEHVLSKPLTLDPPGALTLRIEPPLADDRQQWTVDLTRVSGGSLHPVTTSHADETGFWKMDEIQRGFYIVAVKDHQGATVDRIDVEIDRDLTSVESRIGMVPIEGRIRIGANPIAAQLEFKSASRDVKVRSTDDGHFEGWLPAEGSWNVRVVPKGSLQIIESRVSIKAREDGRRAKVDVDLPGGTVEGRVNDEEGRAVPRAVIRVRRGSAILAHAASDSEGRFQVTGLANGDISLYAYKADLFSEERHLTVSSSAPVKETLTLRSAMELRGTLTYASGTPAVGALIRYFRGNQIREAVSGPTGSFSLELDPGATFADVIVLTTRRHVAIERVPLRSDRVRIVIAEPPALLRIAPRRGSGIPQLSRHDRLFPLSLLFSPPQGMDTPPEFASDGYELIVSPGTYTVCYARAECVSVDARPGEVVRIMPPRAEGKP